MCFNLDEINHTINSVFMKLFEQEQFFLEIFFSLIPEVNDAKYTRVPDPLATESIPEYFWLPDYSIAKFQEKKLEYLSIPIKLN